jgi:uncharacterized repeat protein (TIGR01451 family)
MKSQFLPLLVFFFFVNITFSFCQEWRLYNGPDAVTAFEIYHDQLWIMSGSGLTQMNINTGVKTTWNTINSQLPQYRGTALTIDSSGLVWMGGTDNPNITRFDGVNWDILTTINGHSVEGTLDLLTAPDGKVWMYGNYDNTQLYYFENGNFVEATLPAGKIFSSSSIGTITIDSESHLWVMVQDSAISTFYIGEYDGMQWIIHDPSSLGAILRSDDHLVSDHHGNIYALLSSFNGPHFIKYVGSQWQIINLPADYDQYVYLQRPIYSDSDGQTWINLENNTVLRYDGQYWTTIDLTTNGLTGGYADGMRLDTYGRWWIIYNQTIGASVFTLYKIESSTNTKIDLSNSSLPTNSLYSSFVDALNNKWFTCPAGLTKFDGTHWTTIQQNEQLASTTPVASNYTGGVWMTPYASELPLFDGLIHTSIQVHDQMGMPYNILGNLVSDRKGKAYVATYENEIVVFDQGDISYLDSIPVVLSGFPFPQDRIEEVELDTADRLYALGNGLHRLEENGTWTQIPLYSESPAETGIFRVAPNNDIWMRTNYLFPDEGWKFQVYDGSQWSAKQLPFKVLLLPKWDSHGHTWIFSDQGLCKETNGNWTCYNRSNSPFDPKSLSSFFIDAHDNIWIALYYGGVLVFNENQITDIDGTDLPLLSGSVYRDLNTNNIKDDTDTPINLHRILILPDSTYTFSHSDGAFRIPVVPGTHTVKYIPKENWQIANSPEDYTMTVGTDDVTDLDFRIAPIQEISDLQLYVSEGFPRCNHESYYWLTYSNDGTQAESGEVKFIKDPLADLLETYPAPAFVSGDTVIWAFSNLLPTARSKVLVDLQLPGANDTDSLHFKSYLDRIDNNLHERKDSVITDQELACAYDPNDKTAKSENTTPDGKFSAKDDILYTIRFQNTGNDTAFTIVIRDTLETDLDITTLEIISASHPYELSLKSHRILEFIFPHILLPDSTTNEPASHGFISYSIKANQNIFANTMITNTAHIYFDSNIGVRTNTTTNEVVNFSVGTSERQKNKPWIKAYPSPASDEILLQSDISATTLSYQLLNALGNVVAYGLMSPGELKHVDIRSLPTGVYVIRVNNGISFSTSTFVKQ